MNALIDSIVPFDTTLADAMRQDIERALAEDIGGGDVTARLLPRDRMLRARVIVRESAILCGAPWFEGV
ncbi:MAG TPA: nicotinate-nucleotide diphosphorylase (carboxylating), partial [Casimicrobiaceae bacterium]|nr:nicotinate-nucleotide diphosphorylase (carboxylating) [Casimicrobiaceae bacterium]